MIKLLIRQALERSRLVRGPLHRNDRAGALHRAWGHVFTNHLAGDYFEFGVYSGNSFIESHKQYRLFRKWLLAELKSGEAWRREVSADYIGKVASFHGLDTFSGMPTNEEQNRTFASGTFAADLQAVEARCRAEFNAEAGFTLHKGLFSEAPANWIPEGTKAAIINVDGDLYSSCVDALALSRPTMQVGTVVMMDDYNTFCADASKGERRALREFVDQSGISIEPWFPYMFVGQAFLVVGLP